MHDRHKYTKRQEYGYRKFVDSRGTAETIEKKLTYDDQRLENKNINFNN